MTELNIHRRKKLNFNLVTKEKTFLVSPYELKQNIQKILEKHFKEGNFVIEITIVSRKKFRELNLKYRSKTDFGEVLSFPLFKNRKSLKDFFVLKDTSFPILLGTISLCPTCIRKNLQIKTKQEYKKRILELVCHSTYHLLGIHHE